MLRYSTTSCDESVNLSSDEFSSVSDATESDSDDLDNVRVWCKVDPQQPSAAPPSIYASIYYIFITAKAYEL